MENAFNARLPAHDVDAHAIPGAGAQVSRPAPPLTYRNSGLIKKGKTTHGATILVDLSYDYTIGSGSTVRFGITLNVAPGSAPPMSSSEDRPLRRSRPMPHVKMPASAGSRCCRNAPSISSPGATRLAADPCPAQAPHQEGACSAGAVGGATHRSVGGADAGGEKGTVWQAGSR